MVTDTRASLTSRVLVNGALMLAALYFLLPVVWVLFAATKSTSDLFGTFGLWFSDSPQAWQNLVQLFTRDGGTFSLWMLNSVIYSGVGAFVAMVLSAAAGYAFAKYRFRGRETLFSVILGGVLVPATIIALPLYFLLNTVGLTGSYWSVLLPSMVSPFGVYLARIHANASVPDEVIEAARLDGANDVRIFGSIATRMMTPALVTIFLFQFVTIWNNYLLPLVMLNDTKSFPITLGLTLWNSQTQRDPAFYQLVVTGAAVSTILLVALMVSLQRFWKADLAAGSTK
ncbi:carbohydrate ABC transporter permease [Agromyces atrinae]|uniref:Carbohydrate ABC transporter permease n=1 Tax=Agromyces atrinae TaxID=592376 RepID=A0A4Q2M889_9MICO|nr:carbohydrate ABC transporter permease [Agromyces atrinae]MCI2957663.1 carbohydrate ABC transporter permease [Agromyces atrinae]NYD67028.1 multiple sugar transport system permease protein [Agromyces atrinae]RXZ85242.1 carbohydrate ABC transporter permease [Agromyces atrinae]RXZ85350.1 carbohydrate ABC transporter permease [Agromyces atrinae]